VVVRFTSNKSFLLVGNVKNKRSVHHFLSIEEIDEVTDVKFASGISEEVPRTSAISTLSKMAFYKIRSHDISLAIFLSLPTLKKLEMGAHLVRSSKACGNVRSSSVRVSAYPIPLATTKLAER